MDTPKDPSLAQLIAYLSFSDPGDQDALLRRIMHVGLRLVGGQEGSIMLADWDKQELVFQITVPENESAEKLKGKGFPMSASLSGEVVMTGRPQASTPRFVDLPDGRPTAVLAAPLVAGSNEAVLGVLSAVKFAPGETFSASDVDLYTEFARICGELLKQRLREARLKEIFAGEASSESESLLHFLRQGVLGDEEKQVQALSMRISRLARGNTLAFEILSELIDSAMALGRLAALNDIVD